MEEEKEAKKIVFPQSPIGVGDIKTKLNEELKDIEKRKEKHSGKKEIISNLEEQEKTIKQQLDIVNDVPDIMEVMKKVQESLTKLMPLGKKHSNLKDEYLNLIDK